MNRFHGMNFRDETEWRGLMLGGAYAIRGLLTELGAWLAALVFAYQFDLKWPRFHFIACAAAVMFVRMISTHYDDWRKLRAVERALRR